MKSAWRVEACDGHSALTRSALRVLQKDGKEMRGIQFVVDDKGEQTAVLIDLQEHGELWEDFYDCLIAQARANEPRESLAEVREQLR